jgi:uncharacterized MAPEG superfamily protein
MGATNPAFSTYAIASTIIALHPRRRPASERAHANALESAVPFFAVGALYATVGQSKTAALAYFGSFVVARLLHSVVYIWGKQPLRTIFFAVGVLSIIGMAVHVLRFYA